MEDVRRRGGHIRERRIMHQLRERLRVENGGI